MASNKDEINKSRIAEYIQRLMWSYSIAEDEPKVLNYFNSLFAFQSKPKTLKEHFMVKFGNGMDDDHKNVFDNVEPHKAFNKTVKSDNKFLFALDEALVCAKHECEATNHLVVRDYLEENPLSEDEAIEKTKSIIHYYFDDNSEAYDEFVKQVNPNLSYIYIKEIEDLVLNDSGVVDREVFNKKMAEIKDNEVELKKFIAAFAVMASANNKINAVTLKRSVTIDKMQYLANKEPAAQVYINGNTVRLSGICATIDRQNEDELDVMNKQYNEVIDSLSKFDKLTIKYIDSVNDTSNNIIAKKFKNILHSDVNYLSMQAKATLLATGASSSKLFNSAFNNIKFKHKGVIDTTLTGFALMYFPSTSLTENAKYFATKKEVDNTLPLVKTLASLISARKIAGYNKIGVRALSDDVIYASLISSTINKISEIEKRYKEIVWIAPLVQSLSSEIERSYCESNGLDYETFTTDSVRKVGEIYDDARRRANQGKDNGFDDFKDLQTLQIAGHYDTDVNDVLTLESADTKEPKIVKRIVASEVDDQVNVDEGEEYIPDEGEVVTEESEEYIHDEGEEYISEKDEKYIPAEVEILEQSNLDEKEIIDENDLPANPPKVIHLGSATKIDKNSVKLNIELEKIKQNLKNKLTVHGENYNSKLDKITQNLGNKKSQINQNESKFIHNKSQIIKNMALAHPSSDNVFYQNVVTESDLDEFGKKAYCDIIVDELIGKKQYKSSGKIFENAYNKRKEQLDKYNGDYILIVIDIIGRLKYEGTDEEKREIIEKYKDVLQAQSKINRDMTVQNNLNIEKDGAGIVAEEDNNAEIENNNVNEVENEVNEVENDDEKNVTNEENKTTKSTNKQELIKKAINSINNLKSTKDNEDKIRYTYLDYAWSSLGGSIRKLTTQNHRFKNIMNTIFNNKTLDCRVLDYVPYNNYTINKNVEVSIESLNNEIEYYKAFAEHEEIKNTEDFKYAIASKIYLDGLCKIKDRYENASLDQLKGECTEILQNKDIMIDEDSLAKNYSELLIHLENAIHEETNQKKNKKMELGD